MQTKKRAKPVKFGKPTVKKETEGPREPEEAKVINKSVEADIESDEAKQLKQIIEERTHPHDEDEEIRKEAEEREEDTESNLEDEPMEVKLSEEPEEKEEKELDDDSDPFDEEDLEDEKSDLVEADEKAAKKKEEEPEEDEEDEEDEVYEEPERESVRKTSFGSFTKEEAIKERKKNTWFSYFIITIVAFLIGLSLIAGGSYVLSTFDTGTVKLPNIQMSSSEASPTPQPTEQPTPTSAEADLSAYTIKVLNGSGTTGEAAKVKTSLTDAGFTVGGTGNADTSDYTKTVISAKDDVDEAYLKTLIKEVSKTYEVDSVTETLSASSGDDVIVTIGSSTAK